MVPDSVVRKLIKDQSVNDHRSRALNPDRPSLRGSAANPDTYFQAREAANPWYNALPAIVQTAMDQFAAETGRAYHLFDYEGHPEAEEIIVIMGSGAETAAEAARFLNAKHGRRTGVLKVRLFRPFSIEHFLTALPVTTKAIAVLDRTKEPGCAASRSIRTFSPPSSKASPQALCRSRLSRASSAVATVCPPKSSARRW